MTKRYDSDVVRKQRQNAAAIRAMAAGKAIPAPIPAPETAIAAAFRRAAESAK